MKCRLQPADSQPPHTTDWAHTALLEHGAAQGEGHASQLWVDKDLTTAQGMWLQGPLWWADGRALPQPQGLSNSGPCQGPAQAMGWLHMASSERPTPFCPGATDSVNPLTTRPAWSSSLSAPAGLSPTHRHLQSSARPSPHWHLTACPTDGRTGTRSPGLLSPVVDTGLLQLGMHMSLDDARGHFLWYSLLKRHRN